MLVLKTSWWIKRQEWSHLFCQAKVAKESERQVRQLQRERQVKQLHQSEQNEKHLKLSGAREWYEIVFVPHEQQIGRHLHKDLFLDEKAMPHVYVIVSRIWGRTGWEKSIENKISNKVSSSRTNLWFAPSPDQFSCCRMSVICQITTYFYLTCSFAIWVCTLELQQP